MKTVIQKDCLADTENGYSTVVVEKWGRKDT